MFSKMILTDKKGQTREWDQQDLRFGEDATIYSQTVCSVSFPFIPLKNLMAAWT